MPASSSENDLLEAKFGGKKRNCAILTSALSAEGKLQDLVVIKRIKLHSSEELDILSHSEPAAKEGSLNSGCIASLCQCRI
jgi:hypothetical protein